MGKWQLNRPGTWVYPSIRVVASDGDVIEADYQIDQYWSTVAESTPATIDPPKPDLPVYSETPDGAAFMYDVNKNAFVPTPLVVFDTTTGKVLDGVLPDRLSDAAIQADLSAKADVSYVDTGLAGKVDDAEVGAASGVAPLDAGGVVPSANLPSIPANFTDLADVDGTAPTDGQVYAWDAGTGLLSPVDVAAGGSTTGMFVGALMGFTGEGPAPSGWLDADGTTFVDTDYPELASFLGDRFNTGGEPAGETRLPDWRGKTIVGLDAGDVDFDTVGNEGGAKTHTLTEAEMPSHTHATNIGYSDYGTPDWDLDYQGAGGRSFVTDYSQTSTATGGGSAHNIMSPYGVARILICADTSAAGGVTTTFAGLTDVDATTPTDGQVYAYDAASGLLKPSDPATGGAAAYADLTDVDWTTPPTDGQVFAWDTASGKFLPTDPATGGSYTLPTRLETKCETITDWNATLDNGWYMGNNVANAPGTGWFYGEVIAHNDLYVTQHAWGFSPPTNGYIRHMRNGVWTAWEAVYTTAAELNASPLGQDVANLEATAATTEELICSVQQPLRFVAGTPQNEFSSNVSDVIFVAPFDCYIVSADYVRQYGSGAANQSNGLTVALARYNSAGVFQGNAAYKDTSVYPMSNQGTWSFDNANWNETHRALSKGEQICLEHNVNGGTATVRYPLAITFRYRPV